MTKKRERSEVEHLRSENRKMKAIIRHLKKLTNGSDKKLRGYDQFVGDPDAPIPNEVTRASKVRCPDCSAELDVADLIIKELHTCECGYRKIFNKKKEPDAD